MNPIIIISIFACIIFLLLLLGAPVNSIRYVGQGAIRLIIGALFLFFLNTFGSVFDYYIPINLATIAVSGFLGIPGLLALLAIDFFII